MSIGSNEVATAAIIAAPMIAIAQTLYDQFSDWLRRHPRVKAGREVLAFAARRMRAAQMQQVASSLTLTTVLSIVPLLAVALAMFAAFPLFSEYREAFEKLLIKNLLPSEFNTSILRYLRQFATKAAGLTAFGLAGLASSALLMIFTIDAALNSIFNVRDQRPIGQRVLIYWALITLGPVMLGASLTLTSYFTSISLVGVPQGGFPAWGVGLTQIALTGVTLAVLYVYVPYRKVQWHDALIGGFTVALVSQLVKEGFSLFVASGTVTSIYGAFSALPVFLIWVYLSWLLALFGAAITATLPMLRSMRFADEVKVGNGFVTAVALLRELMVARASDQPEVKLAALARTVISFPEETERLLRQLESRGYVAELAGDYVDHWMLLADPASTNLVGAFEVLAIDPSNSLVGVAGSPLQGWMRQGLTAGWIERPMAETLA